MKRLFVLLACALCALSARAADEAVFDEDDHWNLFTRLDLTYTELGGEDAYLGGVQVGGLLNDSFSAGLVLRALVTEIEPGYNGYNNPEEFDFGYGGLSLEYTFLARRLVHASVSGLVGGGWLRLDRTSDGEDKDIQLFVLEPGVNAMVNVTQRTELGLGVSYRHTDPYSNKIEGLSDGDLSGAAVSIFLRVTEF